MGLLFQGGNISPGGQVYDRTTGSWVGENRGSIGEGSNYSMAETPTRVIHDANGPVGVQILPRGSSSGGGGGSGSASAQVTSNGTSAPVLGPGSPGAQTGGPNSGGRGSGSSLVIGGPRMSTSVIDWRTPGAWENAPDIPGVKNKPLERIGVGGPQEAAGAISDIGWVRTNTGWTSVPSSDAKERIEDDLIQQTSWTVRNKILPDWMITPQPFPQFLSNQEYYQYNGWLGEWQERGQTKSPGGGGAW